MKSLFDPDGRYTPIANAVSEEVRVALTSILTKYVSQGYSIREVAHLALLATFDVEIDLMLSDLTKNHPKE